METAGRICPEPGNAWGAAISTWESTSSRGNAEDGCQRGSPIDQDTGVESSPSAASDPRKGTPSSLASAHQSTRNQFERHTSSPE